LLNQPVNQDLFWHSYSSIYMKNKPTNSGGV